MEQRGVQREGMQKLVPVQEIQDTRWMEDREVSHAQTSGAVGV